MLVMCSDQRVQHLCKFYVTCHRNARKCSDTCTCNLPRSFRVPPTQELRKREKERKEKNKGDDF